MYWIIKGSLGTHILPTKRHPTMINFNPHQPSWITAAASFCIKTIVKITNWKRARVRLILTSPLALKQASPPPDSAGHYTPMYSDHQMSLIPANILDNAATIQNIWNTIYPIFEKSLASTPNALNGIQTDTGSTAFSRVATCNSWNWNVRIPRHYLLAKLL